MVEQLICNQQVAGSIPIASSLAGRRKQKRKQEQQEPYPTANPGPIKKTETTGKTARIAWSSRIGCFSSEGFPSGQRVQTVNLSPLASKVRILPPPQASAFSFRHQHDQISFPKENSKFAGVAQLVELQPSKLVVAGSRPVSRSETGRRRNSSQRPKEEIAHVAQLAERVLGKDEVTRSIRVVGSNGTRKKIRVGNAPKRSTSPQGAKGRIGRWRKRNSSETSRT